MDIINFLYANGFIQSKHCSSELIAKRYELFCSKQKTASDVRTSIYIPRNPTRKIVDSCELNQHIRSVLGLD